MSHVNEKRTKQERDKNVTVLQICHCCKNVTVANLSQCCIFAKMCTEISVRHFRCATFRCATFGTPLLVYHFSLFTLFSSSANHLFQHEYQLRYALCVALCCYGMMHIVIVYLLMIQIGSSYPYVELCDLPHKQELCAHPHSTFYIQGR